MDSIATQTTLHVPARDIPIPGSISLQAQAIMARPGWGAQSYPALGDMEGWRKYAAGINAMMLPVLEAKASSVDAEVRDMDVDGVRIYDIQPRVTPTDSKAIFFDIHGGGFIVGAGDCCRAEARGLAGDIGVRVWSVDYRAPPDFPYPAPLDDCIVAYRALLKQCDSRDIIVGGASAGANLAAALVLRARDEGLPLPAGVVLHTPGLDLTNSGDSFVVNNGLDAVLSAGSDVMLELYRGGHDPRHPYVSPLFGDFSKGFPKSFLSAGTRDLLLSSAVLMHAKLRAADVDAELHIIEAASHGGFHGAPEEDHINREVRKFIQSAVRRS